MRIDFKRLEIHSFLSFADEVFDFSAHHGMNLVYGKNLDVPGSKNGSGKSSLPAALAFALFGETSQRLKNASVHNRFLPGKDVRVVAWFSVDRAEWKIASGFDKRGAPYCQLSKIDSSGQEEDVSKSTIAETRKYVEKELLKCDLPMFMRTVLLSSDQNYNFFNLRKWEKKEFIEKLFDIAVFGEMHAAIHKDSLSREKEMQSCQDKLLVLSKAADDYREQSASWLAKKNARGNELAEEASRLEAVLEKLKSERVAVDQAEIARWEAAAEKVDRASRLLDEKRRKASETKTEREAAKRVALASAAQKKKLVEKHAGVMSKLCPDCKKVFSDYYSIGVVEAEIAQCESQAEKAAAETSEAEATLVAVKQKSTEIESKREKIAAKIASLTEAANQANEKIRQTESKLHSVVVQKAGLDSQTDPYSGLLATNSQQTAEQEALLDKLDEEHRHLKFAESVVSQDTLRKFIISDLIGLLNARIKHYLLKFGARYSVVFDEDMEYEFQTESGPCEYGNFSAGERARIMIASCFAFRDFMKARNNLSSNVLILDEFIDGAIDSLAIESILEILKQFSQTWDQSVYVISHRKEVDCSSFDGMVEIVKSGNVSRINYPEA